MVLVERQLLIEYKSEMRPANSVDTASEVVPHYSYELPIEEEERFEKLFRQLDVNGDGRIDILELSQSLHKHGVPDNLKESYATVWSHDLRRILITFVC